jgi:hypothetical protein
MGPTHRQRHVGSSSLSMTSGLLIAFPVLSLLVGYSPSDVTLASDAGSEFPWWTPIAVSLLLVLVSLIYRWREHRHTPSDEVNGNEIPPQTHP